MRRELILCAIVVLTAASCARVDPTVHSSAACSETEAPEECGCWANACGSDQGRCEGAPLTYGRGTLWARIVALETDLRGLEQQAYPYRGLSRAQQARVKVLKSRARRYAQELLALVSSVHANRAEISQRRWRLVSLEVPVLLTASARSPQIGRMVAEAHGRLAALEAQGNQVLSRLIDWYIFTLSIEARANVLSWHGERRE